MPEEPFVMDLNSAIDLLEDYTLNKPLARSRNYRIFQNALDNNVPMSSLLVDRLLAVCAHDLQEDKQYSHTILNIIKSISKRLKAGDFDMLTNILPSALEVLNFMRTIAQFNSTETLQVLSLETVNSFHDDILIELATLHTEEVSTVFDLYCNDKKPLEIKSLAFEIIHKLLQVLPEENKTTFLKDKLKVIFTRIIPAIIICIENEALSTKSLETLESMTDILVHIDYSEDVNWQSFLKCIYNPEKYPLLMKNMLERGSKTWHRLWIVIIRLLKHQITRISSPGGSPINSMLPVVETAFKMDVTNRCRAFQCWDVLIDNFRTETNEANIVKRIKLLIIPLKSNNAKVEATALAKLNTWWHLIRSFENRVDKFVDAMLVSFLHFCFGKHSLQNKQSFVPCLLTERTKKRAVEAFIEIAGHLNCNGCVDFPKLKERIITKKILVDFWNDWVFSLKVAISISTENIEVTQQQITCAWKSFVLIISELPDNNIRKDLFDELLCMLETLLQYSPSNDKKTEMVFNLIISLFGDEKVKALLKSKSEKEEPMHKIISLLTRPSLIVYYRSQQTKEIISKLKLVTSYVMDENICLPKKLVNWTFSNFPLDSLCFFWTAIAETLHDSCSENVAILENIILWPLGDYSHYDFADMTYSSLVYYKLLELSYPKISADIRDKLKNYIIRNNVTNYNLLFKLNVALVILNQPSLGCDYETPVETIMAVTDSLKDFTQIESICNLLTDALVRELNNAMSLDKVKLGKNAITCVKNIMKLLVVKLQQENDMSMYESILQTLLVQVDTFFRPCKKLQQSCVLIIVDELINLSSLLKNHESLKKSLLSTLKTCLMNVNENFPAYNAIKAAVDNIEPNAESGNKTAEKRVSENKFTTPDVKKITRKAKRKEASIVSTVVDNGEEFIVVKSNWKFNPRKLTENQKEKLQRKREDIPALYQDLSQSQDEFKLTTWKTDSQDSSSTNSKSTSVSKSSNVEDVSNILKNIPSSDVCPKIIENIFSDNGKKESVEDTTGKSTVVTVDSLKKMTTPKDSKSPRMALKDRVFRNVRNLIEKSGAHKDGKDLSESLVQTENIPKTPTSKVNDNTNLINSAPAKINAERPSRVKRKPKKFEDTEIFALKRNRRSLSQSDSQNDISDEPSLENKLPQISQSVLGTVPQNNDDGQCKNIIKTDNESRGEVIEPLSDTSKTDITPQGKKEDCLTITDNVLPIDITDTPEQKSQVKIITKDEDGVQICEKKPEQKDTEIAENAQEVVKLDLINENEYKAADTVQEKISSNETSKTPKFELINQNKAADSVQEKRASNETSKTPKSTKKQEGGNQKSSSKIGSNKKSRIEKELAIDTVEGHPFLKINSERRVTRKNVVNPLNNSRRKSLAEKLNKSKSDALTPSKISASNTKKRDKERTSNESTESNEVVTVKDSQDKSQSQSNSDCAEEFPLSEDVIESSQDSTFTTICAASTKNNNKKLSVLVEKCPLISPKDNLLTATEPMETDVELGSDYTLHQNSERSDKDDSDFPQNKAASQKSDCDSTENMDTEPIDDKTFELKDNSSDVIIINDDDGPPIEINTEETCVGPESQEIAEADTQPIDPNKFMDNLGNGKKATLEKDVDVKDTHKVIPESKEKTVTHEEEVNTDKDFTRTFCESIDGSSRDQDDANTVLSPFQDEEQRKKDFLDNTLEISPIKTMSPVREKKSPSPETSSDYVVITLSSPVQSNGEPFDKSNSPEIFTEEKISPDKRDLSPPRETSNGNNVSSPSSSLSLKKNKPQVRSGRRAAHMLGLCVPDRLQTIINNERSETEEPKKISPSSTPARRNLRILYNSVGENNENPEEKEEESENFLKFKRSVPTSDCSPSGPILKRKLTEIMDDATITPASKRKRVSFHDPPVSTTVSVQKYIEPCGIRSPQNSALKRQERQNLRSQTVLKSPKRLDNVFKLDSVLTKAVESFSELDRTSTEDTQSMSLDETPAVEIIKNSDLNDSDPLCPELIDCMDPIDVIANDLSSPTMKAAFLKKIEGKLSTVGDLAKMTELEVNRLCIKAPKVKVAKKVLNDYCLKKAFEQSGPKEVTIVDVDDTVSTVEKIEAKMDTETQTEDRVLNNTEMQTDASILTAVSVQTDKMVTCHTIVQTEESGNKSTKDIITTCVAEKPDFIDLLGKSLEESSKLKIAESLSFEAFKNAFMDKVTVNNSKTIIAQILEGQNDTGSHNGNGELSFLQNYICERFSNSDIILFCSQLLGKIHARPS